MVVTSNGNPYMNWQTRIMHATWRKHAPKEDVFTRILHRSTDDELMREVPTMRFEPWHVECDAWCDFPVKDRARAVFEWSHTPDANRCSHIMLGETDYAFVRPPSRSLLLPQGKAQAFHFGYINPLHPHARQAAERVFPSSEGRLEDVPRTGNAPTVMQRDDLKHVVSYWKHYVDVVENDTFVRNTLGWIRDMYAYAFAATKAGVKHQLDLPPHSPLMVQPPADSELGQACILHYTWGALLYAPNDTKVWEFEKRAYNGGQWNPGPYKLTKVSGFFLLEGSSASHEKSIASK